MAFDNSSIESQNELEKFKTEIDLVSFIRKDGYDVDHAVSSHSTIALRNDSTGSLIFIKTTTQGHQIYNDKKAPLETSFAGGKNGGTIIDYVQKYHNKSLGQARVELRAALNNGIPTVSFDQTQNRIAKAKVPISEDHFKFTRINNTQYLNDRGISNDTIFSPTFSGRVGEKLILSANSASTYYSTVFPMYERLTEKVCGLEVKNHLFSGSYRSSNKEEGFWKSNVPPLAEGQKPKAHIGEAPIDSFSHYQLHNRDNKQGIIYYATNGEIGGDSARMKILNEYFTPRQEKFDGFILANDNDAAGVRFNINIIGNINLKEADSSITITAEADPNYARITFISQDKAKAVKFAEEIHIINNKLPVDSNANLQYKYPAKLADRIIEMPDGKHKFQFIMTNRKDNLMPIEELSLKAKNSPFEVQRAIGKDFSIDLEKKLGIERIKVEYGTHKDSGKPLTRNQWRKKTEPGNLESPGFDLER